MNTFSQIRTPEAAKAWFDRHGVSVREWSLQHGFAPATVYAVLAGRCTGRRGQAHHIAIALGLKEGASAGELSPLAAPTPLLPQGGAAADPPDPSPSSEGRLTMR
ncbi:MAG: DNA-binding protein [Betaproteobacteria bacterium]|nr:DNA-binding protein [Betaproteobacteria bacterium]